MKRQINLAVLLPSTAFILLLAGFSALLPRQSERILTSLRALMFEHFSWFFVLAVSFLCAFMVLLALSKYGDIRLGGDEARPEFSFSAWVCMLFAAGMGVGIMYFGAAEPVIHKHTLALSDEEAMLRTIFHWGLHPWAIYGACALAMAYFGFRYKMPLSLRSAFYPFLKDKIHGTAGHIIDILALVVSVFGISTTLGYSAVQLDAGLFTLNITSAQGYFNQALIIIIIIILSVLSTASGIKKGIKKVSEINLILALLLMLFVLFTSHPVHLLASFSANIGEYFSNILKMSFDTAVYEPSRAQWFGDWTLFYWAWWLSWAPFVGFFIAKISKGRTIREFIFGVLLVPTSLNILWFSIFGNGALLNFDALTTLANAPEQLLFALLKTLPLPLISCALALIVLALFFITSANSGIVVLNSLAGCDGKGASVLWGAVLASIALALLRAGGLDAILCVTMIVALPFALLLVLMCASLFYALQIDRRYFNTKLSNSSVYWSGEHWQERLELIINQPQKHDAQEFLDAVALPAMQKIAEKLADLECKCEIKRASNSLQLVIAKELSRDFAYGVRIAKRSTAQSLIDDLYAPFKQKFSYEPVSFFSDGRPGYDLQYMSERELIVDILKQYERYLRLLNNDANEIFTKSYEC